MEGVGDGVVYPLHVAKYRKSHLATNYFPLWPKPKPKPKKKKKNRSISGAIVGLSGLVGIRPHRLVLLGLLSSLSHTPHSPIPIPIAASLTSRDVDVNKLSERLTSI